MRRIECSTSYSRFAEADFVVENVTEKWPIKKEVYERLEVVCPKHTIYAANTLGDLHHSDRFSHRKSSAGAGHALYESCADEVYSRGNTRLSHVGRNDRDRQRFVGQHGKEGIVVRDSPGFVSNRVLMLTINEAIWVLQDGVATAEDVDRIFVTCFGHKMGPLATADLIGLDTILFSIETLYESFNDSKFRPCPLLKKMVDAGLYGLESAQGFYCYGGRE